MSISILYTMIFIMLLAMIVAVVLVLAYFAAMRIWAKDFWEELTRRD